MAPILIPYFCLQDDQFADLPAPCQELLNMLKEEMMADQSTFSLIPGDNLRFGVKASGPRAKVGT